MNKKALNSEATTHNQDARTASSVRQRITFATGKTLAFVSVLELTSIWERSLRRAAVPLRYSQGYNPRPKMNFAAPLPVGCGTKEDLLDIWLEYDMNAEDVLSALYNRTPDNLHVINVAAVHPDEPVLAERLESAEYSAWLDGPGRSELSHKIDKLLTASTILRQRRGRKYRGKTYDLRPLILDLRLSPDTLHSWIKIKMHLKAQPGATGRPDEVLKAMEVMGNLHRCSRTCLILAGLQINCGAETR